MNLSKFNPFSISLGNRDDAYGLVYISGFLVASVFVVFCIALSGTGSWHVLGLSFIIGLAALVSGSLFGFLFGIPRKLQISKVVGADNPENFTDNTNLEEISDWLTKIIVGISLTQLPKIEFEFNLLCHNLSKSFDSYLAPSFSYIYSGALIIFYFLAGFLAVYLWARTFLKQSLSKKYKSEIDEKFRLKEIEEQRKELEKQKKDFQKSATRIEVEERKPAFRDLVGRAKPLPPTVYNDPQRNRWGAKSTDANFTINAVITPATNLATKAEVTISVDGPPANLADIKRVLLLNHDTVAEMIKEVTKNANNVFECSVSFYEAFTIGIIVEKNDGSVFTYEIDLNKLPGLDDEFRYEDNLMTIDQINAKLSSL